MGFGDLFSRSTQEDRGNPKPDPDFSLAFLGSIVESSDDAIVGTTPEGMIISWNAAAERIYGYPPDEALGQPIAMLIPEELREQHASILARVRQGERVDHFEATRLARDRRQLSVSLTVSPVRDATGMVFATSEIARDTEAQKRSERASAQLAAIVESSDDAVVSKTLDGVIQSWNAAAERIFGYRAEEIIGQHITTIIPPRLHDEEYAILRRIRAGERIEHFDTIRIGKNGRRIPVSLTVSPILGANGEIIGASKIARDISERHRAERDLHESRHKLAMEAVALARLGEASVRLWESQSLASGLDEILRTARSLVGAPKGNIQLLNPGRNTLSIVGYEGFDSAFLATFEHLDANDERLACCRALASGRPVIIEDVVADEAYLPFLGVAREAGYRAVVSVPLRAADGSRLGAISMHFPAPHRPTESEMRRLQLYCRQASDFIQRIRLEHSLRERDLALRESDRRKDEFLALLAHELRNPLAPIRYAVATARKRAATAEQQARSLAIIERQVDHMGRLLDDLLDISRITRGVLALKKVRTDLVTAVELSIEAAQPLIDEKRLQLTVNLPGHPVILEADPLRIAQVFSNLLVNAARHTMRGGHIELSATNGDGQVIVTVRDDGVGIPADLMPKLFTLFTRGTGMTSGADNGLGVGLAMVRGLVELHGGAVMAHSEGLGHGSEFIVRLPVGDVPDSQAALPVPVYDDFVATLRVLVVDDNRDAADSCASMLELSGHQVEKAYDGAQALQIGREFHPQVVLLDVGLPDLDGYEVARRMRASDWGASIPLVAVTGWGKVEDRERAFAAGFNHHLTKPVAPDAVEAVVHSAAVPA
jgi:PAS domain S-box-containing protein